MVSSFHVPLCPYSTQIRIPPAYFFGHPFPGLLPRTYEGCRSAVERSTTPGTSATRSATGRSCSSLTVRRSRVSLIVPRSQILPAFGVASALGVVLRERIDVLLFLEQGADEGNVRLDLFDTDAGTDEGADPVDELGRRRLLPQLALLPQPVEFDQHLVEQLGVEMRM